MDVQWLILLLFLLNVRTTTASLVVVSPAWLASLKLGARCSLTSSFWGQPLKKQGRFTVVANPSPQVICGESLQGYMVVSNFHYLDNMKDKFELPCFDQEFGTLMSLFKSGASVVAHNHTKYSPEFARGLLWSDNMYNDRKAFVKELNPWIETSVIDCDWDEQLLEILLESSTWNASDPVQVEIEVERSEFEKLFGNLPYPAFVRLLGLFHVMLAVSCFRQVVQNRADQLRKRNRKRKYKPVVVGRGPSKEPLLKPGSIALLVQGLYCLFAATVLIIDAWWSRPIFHTWMRSSCITLATGSFLGISFLEAMVWGDFVNKVSRGILVLAPQDNFFVRYKRVLILAGFILVSLDVGWFIATASMLVDLSDDYISLAFLYLLATLFISACYTREAVRFRRQAIAIGSLGVATKKTEILNTMLMKSTYMVLSSGSKLLFCLWLLVVSSQASFSIIYDPTGWCVAWSLFHVNRLLDCWLQMKVCSKPRRKSLRSVDTNPTDSRPTSSSMF